MTNIVNVPFNREQREKSEVKLALLAMLDNIRQGVEAGEITQAFVCYNSTTFSEEHPSGSLSAPTSAHLAQSEGYETFQLSGVLMHLIAARAING